jgi:hypothetical protein
MVSPHLQPGNTHNRHPVSSGVVPVDARPSIVGPPRGRLTDQGNSGPPSLPRQGHIRVEPNRGKSRRSDADESERIGDHHSRVTLAGPISAARTSGFPTIMARSVRRLKITFEPD